MARPTSTTNPRRRANAAHSVTRRVLPIPASPVITANPPVPDSARSKRSASRISSGSRPTIVIHGVSQARQSMHSVRQSGRNSLLSCSKSDQAANTARTVVVGRLRHRVTNKRLSRLIERITWVCAKKP